MSSSYQFKKIFGSFPFDFFRVSWTSTSISWDVWGNVVVEVCFVVVVGGVCVCCDAVFLFCVWMFRSLSIYEPHFHFFSYTHNNTHTHWQDITTSHHDILSRTVRFHSQLADCWFFFEREKRERESREWNENCFVNWTKAQNSIPNDVVRRIGICFVMDDVPAVRRFRTRTT